jgi:hypothetical protein
LAIIENTAKARIFLLQSSLQRGRGYA